MPPVFKRERHSGQADEHECPLQIGQTKPRVRNFERDLRDEQQNGYLENRFSGHRYLPDKWW